MSQIHDNIIKSYIVDLENGKIVFNTVYCYNDIDIMEETSIEFCNATAHLFSNAMENSIILDIETCNIDDFIKNNSETLAKTKNYGWPYIYKNNDDLIKILHKHNQKYYVIVCAYGLQGWVLAEEMKINVKEMSVHKVNPLRNTGGLYFN
jgi:hypothetical protein